MGGVGHQVSVVSVSGFRAQRFDQRVEGVGFCHRARGVEVGEDAKKLAFEGLLRGLRPAGTPYISVGLL